VDFRRPGNGAMTASLVRHGAVPSWHPTWLTIMDLVVAADLLPLLSESADYVIVGRRAGGAEGGPPRSTKRGEPDLGCGQADCRSLRRAL
jgi:hypothetical protein